MKRKTHKWEEGDVVSRYWRKRYCYLQRAGVTSKIKRQMRRRERREGNVEATVDEASG